MPAHVAVHVRRRVRVDGRRDAWRMNTNSLTGGTSPKPVVTNRPPDARAAPSPCRCSARRRDRSEQGVGAPPGAFGDTAGRLRQHLGHVGNDLDPRRRQRERRSAFASPPRTSAAASATASLDYISDHRSAYYNANERASARPARRSTPLNAGARAPTSCKHAHACASVTEDDWAGYDRRLRRSNPALVDADRRLTYWWKNAEPGPKHFCTYARPGTPTSFFDNDAALSGRG